MTNEQVKQYFVAQGLGDRFRVLNESTATVQLAADAVGCGVQQIAKSMSFFIDDKPALIVCAGNTKVDNQKFKARFKQKSKMIPWDQVEEYTGHAPGGVCPFLTKEDVTVYLDSSLKQSEEIYPAAGSSYSLLRLSLDELETHSDYTEWVDVCKLVEA